MPEYKTGESQENQVREPDMSGSYTARDYLSWTFEGLYELIRGKVYKMSPAPSTDHQTILGNLTGHFYTFFRKKSCKWFGNPLDVYFVKPDENYRNTSIVMQPDILIVCDSQKIHKKGCIGSPDFVLEILSPSTAIKDQREKFEIYEEYGVPEYWIVDPFNRSVTRNILKENGRYEIQRPCFEGETVVPQQFPNLKIQVEDIFEGTMKEEI